MHTYIYIFVQALNSFPKRPNWQGLTKPWTEEAFHLHFWRECKQCIYPHCEDVLPEGTSRIHFWNICLFVPDIYVGRGGHSDLAWHTWCFVTLWCRGGGVSSILSFCPEALLTLQYFRIPRNAKHAKNSNQGNTISGRSPRSVWKELQRSQQHVKSEDFRTSVPGDLCLVFTTHIVCLLTQRNFFFSFLSWVVTVKPQPNHWTKWVVKTQRSPSHVWPKRLPQTLAHLLGLWYQRTC